MTDEWSTDEWSERWAEQVVRLIARLRTRGVDEDELVELELELVRIVGGK
jgi:hypothetical protein